MFLISMLPAAALEPPATSAVAAEERRVGSSERPPGTILVVAEARSSWHGETANRIVEELTRALGPSQSIQVVRFDAEPTAQSDQTIQGLNRDLIVVRPYTPMKEAMETGLLRLITIPGARSMIVVAHNQLHPSSLSTDPLWELAREWEIQIHTIHLASDDKEIGVRRLGKRLRNGISNAFKRGPEQHGESARDTRRFLHFMADVTGGKACVANDEMTGIAAANAIAGEILNGPAGSTNRIRNRNVFPG